MKEVRLTETVLTYLTRRQGLGLGQELENKLEHKYWEHVLERAIAVICRLTEPGLAFQEQMKDVIHCKMRIF